MLHRLTHFGVFVVTLRVWAAVPSLFLSSSSALKCYI